MKPKTKLKTKLKKKNKKAKIRDLSSERFDYTVNHQIIEDAVFDHLVHNLRWPTYNQLVEKTGFCHMTIKRHRKDINLQNFVSDYKTITPTVMRALGLKACKGDARAAKLWLQVVEGFRDKIDLEHTTKADLNKTTDDKTKKKLYEMVLSELDEDENE